MGVWPNVLIALLIADFLDSANSKKTAFQSPTPIQPLSRSQRLGLASGIVVVLSEPKF